MRGGAGIGHESHSSEINNTLSSLARLVDTCVNAGEEITVEQLGAYLTHNCHWVYEGDYAPAECTGLKEVAAEFNKAHAGFSSAMHHYTNRCVEGEEKFSHATWYSISKFRNKESGQITELYGDYSADLVQTQAGKWKISRCVTKPITL